MQKNLFKATGDVVTSILVWWMMNSALVEERDDVKLWIASRNCSEVLAKGFSLKVTGTKACTNLAIWTKACTRLSGLCAVPISP